MIISDEVLHECSNHKGYISSVHVLLCADIFGQVIRRCCCSMCCTSCDTSVPLWYATSKERILMVPEVRVGNDSGIRLWAVIISIAYITTPLQISICCVFVLSLDVSFILQCTGESWRMWTWIWFSYTIGPSCQLQVPSVCMSSKVVITTSMKVRHCKQRSGSVWKKIYASTFLPPCASHAHKRTRYLEQSM